MYLDLWAEKSLMGGDILYHVPKNWSNELYAKASAYLYKRHFQPVCKGLHFVSSEKNICVLHTNDAAEDKTKAGEVV